MGELPSSVRIREVGPRDGFQNEPEVIPTDREGAADRNARGERPAAARGDLVRASRRHPPALRRRAVLEAIERPTDVAYSVLIPNRKGLERALAHRERFDEVNVFLSASESHNRRNVNRTIAESLDGPRATVAAALAEGLRCEGVISVAFGCPYEGEVPQARVFEIAEQLAEAGCEEVSFGDTTGMANPRQVGEFFAPAASALEGIELTAHFHNTRGQGLANVLAALEQGVDSFESAFGELGGSPLTPGATGNISTEDLVSMLEEMGIDDRRRSRAPDRRLKRGPRAPGPAARRSPAARRPGRLAAVALAGSSVKATLSRQRSRPRTPRRSPQRSPRTSSSEARSSSGPTRESRSSRRS